MRRTDTPVDLYRQRQNLLMAEGVDYRVVETDTIEHTQYVVLPRIERIAGGRLAVGDTGALDQFLLCDVILASTGGERRRVVQPMLEPLVDYQTRVARWIRCCARTCSRSTLTKYRTRIAIRCASAGT